MSEPSPATCAAWPAVEQSARIISTGKGTLATLSDLIRGLAGAGLGSLISPILSGINLPGTAWENQRPAILDEARKLTGGKSAWENFTQVFHDNLTALTPHNPGLSGLGDFWAQRQSRYELYRAADGNFQIVDKEAPTVFAGLLGGIGNHRALVRQWTYQRNGLQAIRPIAFDGAGYGWLLQRVLESTHETFLNYSCAVYVLEPDPASLCMLLHLHELQRWGRRLRLFVGEDAVRQFRRGLNEHSHWMAPAAVICDRLQTRPALDIQSTLTEIAKERGNREQSLAAEIRRHYERFTVADWSARYDQALAGEKPLKVLGITSRFTTVLQYSMDELGAAIRAVGHQFILAKETDDQSMDRPELELIAQHKPDLLVMISRMRYENTHLPANMPFICWDQDYLPCMRTHEAAKSLDAMTFVAGAGALAGYQNSNWPRRNCIFSSLAASTHRYNNQPVAEALMRKHRCTFSYTSNASGTPESVAAELGRGYAANSLILPIFNRAAGEVIARANAGDVWHALELVKLVDDIARADGASLEASPRREMLVQLRTISDRAFRHVALDWVAQYCRQKNATLRLYGKGWESHPRFSEFAAGFLAPGEEMRAVYQASDINLQIIETGFQHSRAFDGIAAGGFFLHRSGAETRELDPAADSVFQMARQAQAIGCKTFGQLNASQDPLIVKGWAYARTLVVPGKPEEVCAMLDRWCPAGMEDQEFPYLHEITFAGQDQFAAMADRYLLHPELKRSVAAKLREAVVERFSYDARWREFLRGISDGLRIAAAESGAAGLAAAA